MTYKLRKKQKNKDIKVQKCLLVILALAFIFFWIYFVSLCIWLYVLYVSV